ncbi:MAG TPA: MlaD family protein [Phycisphaerae bacterium]|nr:MlaD family protein [Phycisphaerae bacterium]
MASERTRNLAVGLTMICALAILMYGILLLGKGPGFLQSKPYLVTVEASDANGLLPGAKVNLQGVPVGQVSSVDLETRPDNTLYARFILSIDGSVNIPANADVSVGKGYVGSTSYVIIYGGGGNNTSLLPKDGTATLHATSTDGGLIPHEVFDDIHALKVDLSGLTQQFSQVGKDMHALLTPLSPDEIDHPKPGQPAPPPENISTLVTRLSRTVKSLQDLLGDSNMQSQIRAVVSNLAESTDHLKGTLSKIDGTVGNVNVTVDKFGIAATQASQTLSTAQQQLLVVADKLVATLDQLQKTTRAISEGNGTTGKLINDPRLYDGLVDLSTSLRKTIDDVDLVVKKVNDEGVGIHFGK